MNINTLADLYLEQIRDMHSCERQILEALPRMSEAASHPKLKDALMNHLEQTTVHLERLDRILSDLHKTAGHRTCVAAAGLIEEGEDMIETEGDAEARDAGLICVAQKIEHYEIASYGCLRTYADMLDRDEDAELLEQTLEEEKDSDVELTKLAMSVINDAAIV